MSSGRDPGFFQHCHLCDFSTTNSFNWNVHLATTKHKANAQGLVCPDCGAVYDSKGKLTRHKKNTHKKRKQRIEKYLSKVANPDPDPHPAPNPTTHLASAPAPEKPEEPVLNPSLYPKLRPIIRPRIPETKNQGV